MLRNVFVGDDFLGCSVSVFGLLLLTLLASQIAQRGIVR